MRSIDLNTWNRKQLFDHFNDFADPYFSITIPFDVSNAFKKAKNEGYSFFARYLHDSMKAVNAIENFKFRIEDNKVVRYELIHASPTIMRNDNTFGFSFVEFDDDLNQFIKNIEAEKLRIQNSDDLYPPVNSLDCIHCSAMPWLNFSGHKEPFSGKKDSVPKLAFSQIERKNNRWNMNVSISVNHALVDGYHVSEFSKKFQKYLNS